MYQIKLGMLYRKKVTKTELISLKPSSDADCRNQKVIIRILLVRLVKRNPFIVRLTSDEFKQHIKRAQPRLNGLESLTDDVQVHR